MLIFMQVWKKKSICYRGQVYRNLAATHFRLILYCTGQAASQKKKEQKLHPQKAEMHRKKTKQNNKPWRHRKVSSRGKDTMERAWSCAVWAGKHAAKEGDSISKHSTVEITTDIIHPDITCSALSCT